jgi:hypothetical protein
MDNKGVRRLIMEALGNAVDGLVRDLYSGIDDGPSMAQEPEITSRICQRVEDRLDRRQFGDYVLHVTAQSMPDRGPKSIERISGADLLLSVSLDGPDGFDKTVFVQAKYDRNLERDELQDACRRMETVVGPKGAYVWVYEPDGVKVLSSHQIKTMEGNDVDGLYRRTIEGFMGRILDCFAGSREWGIGERVHRRAAIYKRLRALRIDNGLDIEIRKARPKIVL